VWFALTGLSALVVALGAAAGVATRTSRRRARLLVQVTDMALTDPLTGLLSRRGIERGLTAELARAQRYGHPLSLVFFDVDGLKRVNDAHGHRAGDRVLAAVGSLLAEVSRDHDLCGRLGGDESVVVLPEQDRARALAFRDRVLARLPAYQAAVDLSTPWGLTAGVACCPDDGHTPEDLLAVADRRLYEHRGIDIALVS
jgi:diguanylate cyclase (GGDEF)-like protein